jgi:uncharacterized protein (TIGR03086 family)
MITDTLDLFERSLYDAGALVERVTAADLGLPTPCAGWDLAALIGHMIGQNDGFAAAVRDGDAPLSAYASRRLDAEAPGQRWRESADGLRAAFHAADPADVVRLAEFDREVSVAIALGMQVLDCAVHAWDVAATLGGDYRPRADVAAFVLDSARMIAARPGGTPGVFAPPQGAVSEDPWIEALRLLGR